MNTVFAQYELYLKAVAKANELNKPVIFDALAAAGVTRIMVEFDGAGDSGQIEDITAYAGETPARVPSASLTLHQAAQTTGDLRTTKVNLRAAIETLCYDYLSECQDGWENDDGAYGTFEFDVRDRSIHLDFNARFTHVDNSAYDF
jgi:hypothetical protein